MLLLELTPLGVAKLGVVLAQVPRPCVTLYSSSATAWGRSAVSMPYKPIEMTAVAITCSLALLLRGREATLFALAVRCPVLCPKPLTSLSLRPPCRCRSFGHWTAPGARL